MTPVVVGRWEVEALARPPHHYRSDCCVLDKKADLRPPLPRGGLLVQLCPVCFYIQSSLELWNACGPAAPDGKRLLISVEAEDLVRSATRGLYEILRANTAAVPDDVQG